MRSNPKCLRRAWFACAAAAIGTLAGFGQVAAAGPIGFGVSRDAYLVTGEVAGAYAGSFLLSAAGLEFVKFGSPPQAFNDLRVPTSVDDLSGFTVQSEMDHRVAQLAFENLATGGLFASSAPLSSFSIVGGPIYTASFAAMLDSGFGGLPPTLLEVTYLFERQPPLYAFPHEAYYELQGIAVRLNGVEYSSAPIVIGVQNDLPVQAPEPETLALLGLGLVGLGLSRRRRPS